MNIPESCLVLIRVDSRFQGNLNRSCVQRIGNTHETRFDKYASASVQVHVTVQSASPKPDDDLKTIKYDQDIAAIIDRRPIHCTARKRQVIQTPTRQQEYSYTCI